MQDNHTPTENQEMPASVTPQDLLMPALRTDDDSFPVLKAFQEYIEAERERARRRLVIVSTASIVALVLVVAIFLIAGSLIVGNLMKRNDKLFEALIRQSERPPTVVETVTSPSAGSQSEREELARLREMMQQLGREQTAMQGQVADLQNLPAALTASMAQTISNLAAKAAPPQTAPAAVKPVASVTPPARIAQQPRPSPEPTATPAAAAAEPVKTTPAPAAAPAPASRPTTAATAPAAAPAAPDNSPVTIRLPGRIPPAQQINGYVPASLPVTTDRGFTIPWRIVVPE